MNSMRSHHLLSTKRRRTQQIALKLVFWSAYGPDTTKEKTETKIRAIKTNKCWYVLKKLKPSLDREKDLMVGIMDLMKVRLTKCALAPRLESGCSEFCFVVIFL
nr:uncharacterized protein LOC114822520 [Malus domestica]